MPLHWTKINDEADAKPDDEVFVDAESGAVYVRGKTQGNPTKAEVAAAYGVPSENVIYPLNKKK